MPIFGQETYANLMISFYTATVQMLFQDALRFGSNIATRMVTKRKCALYQKDDSSGVKAD